MKTCGTIAGMNSARMIAALVALAALPVLCAPQDAAPKAGATKDAATKDAPTRNDAGTIEFLEGDVTLVKPDKTRSKPKVGDTVAEGDSIATGATGEAHFNMLDGGYIAARPNTKFRFVQYQAIGEASDRSVLGVLEGSLRIVSGWIGQFSQKNYVVRTPTATIGIRGTDHETHVRLKDDAEGEAGTYDRVYAGGTFIKTASGRVDVAPDKVGFLSAKKGSRPRVLERVPGFFRATRNERLIEGRHARQGPLLEKLREERRNKVKAQIQGKGQGKGRHLRGRE